MGLEKERWHIKKNATRKAKYTPITYNKNPHTHDDGVNVASHEHGSILGVEVEVAGGEEGREVPDGFLWLL